MTKAKVVSLVLVVVMAMAVGLGCVSLNKQAPGVGLGPIMFDELTRTQYVIMDTVEGTAEVKVYLWIFEVPLDKQVGYIGGYAGAAQTGGALAGIISRIPIIGGAGGAISSNKAYLAATYNALGKVPEADAILPTSSQVEVTNVLMGLVKTHKATVKGKAIRVKTDKELGCGKGSCEAQPK
ncbi:MAG: hypothetical protein A2V67_08985 [Deltaproteobacteria bacterium RBG_13_61_14]|nr:MAG: hypothetical protein A2V67_08985 [Deltaproteobacteria bacterium RBG_13_61_14]